MGPFHVFNHLTMQSFCNAPNSDFTFFKRAQSTMFDMIMILFCWHQMKIHAYASRYFMDCLICINVLHIMMPTLSLGDSLNHNFFFVWSSSNPFQQFFSIIYSFFDELMAYMVYISIISYGINSLILVRFFPSKIIYTDIVYFFLCTFSFNT